MDNVELDHNGMLSKLVQTPQRERTTTQEKLRHEFDGAIGFPATHATNINIIRILLLNAF